MNIFVTSPCPIESAQYLDNSRVNKMILESCQMLFTALSYHNIKAFSVGEYTPIKYKVCDVTSMTLVEKVGKKAKKAYYLKGIRVCAPTHPGHPATIWTKETKSNYIWLYKHYMALCQEKLKRTGKAHSYEQYKDILLEHASSVPNGPLTAFANCAARVDLGISYKHLEDVYKAYKLYLNDRWELDKREPKWG